jgi:hypothetical protein
MKRIFLAIFTTVSIVALTCTPTVAQNSIRLSGPNYVGVWNLKLRSGAVYDLKLPGGKNSTLELAVVGEESINGKQAYWVEISSPADGGPVQLVVKMLFYLDTRSAKPTHNPVSWLFSDTAPKNDIVAMRMIFQRPGYAPIDAFAGMNTHGANSPEFLGILSGYRFRDPDTYEFDSEGTYFREEAMRVPKTKLQGKEDVATPARTFSCDHLKFQHGAGEIWITPEAPPFGLVKAVAKDNTTMVLTRLLTGAKDKITDPPVRVDVKQVDDLTGDLWDWIETIPKMAGGGPSTR